MLQLPGNQAPQEFSPDGRFLLFGQDDRTTGGDIWLLPLSAESDKPVAFLRTRFDEGDARFSPDGRWIAYASDESGESEVYVAPREGQGARTRVSTGGGFAPRWRRDGKELIYQAPRHAVMAVAVTAGSGFRAGSPVHLFSSDLPILDYDVSADGQRLLVSEPATAPGPPITFIVNWPGLLKGP